MFDGKVNGCLIYDGALTTSQDEWDRLKWWQKALVKMGLKRKPVGQIETLYRKWGELFKGANCG